MTTYAELVDEAYSRKLYLPNIQRGIVWDEGDILLLIDSVIRGYPIGAMFIWNADIKGIQGIQFRTFNYDFNTSDFLPSLESPADQSQVKLVLDGQQRINALLIALRGQYNGKQCCARLSRLKDVLGEPKEFALDMDFYDSTQLAIKQMEDPPWRPIKDIYYHPLMVSAQLSSAGNYDKDEISDLVQKIKVAFDQEAKIIEIDPKWQADEVVNIFIRVNQAGEVLSNADLIMALVKNKWIDAGERFDRLARELDIDVDSTFVLLNLA